MLFCVIGWDAIGAGEQMMADAERHWSYMDRFADRLIVRGPLISDDGTRHLGSLHVLDAPDRAHVDDFARHEPYQAAGLYRRLEVFRLAETANRPHERTDPDKWATFAHLSWPKTPWPMPTTPPELCTLRNDHRLSFLAIVVDDQATTTTGLIAIATTPEPELTNLLPPPPDHHPTHFSRWRPGGRPPPR